MRRARITLTGDYPYLLSGLGYQRRWRRATFSETYKILPDHLILLAESS